MIPHRVLESHKNSSAIALAYLVTRKDAMMTSNDPRYPDGWDTIHDATVVTISALQLIDHVHHHVRQPITATVGLSQLLADGVFGFASQDQQAAIDRLRISITAIAHAHQWMAEWISARVDSDGNWISDAYGIHPESLKQAAAQPGLPADAAARLQDRSHFEG
jgi:hypothetical protein